LHGVTLVPMGKLVELNTNATHKRPHGFLRTTDW
jgi:hypothetical protein